MMHIILFIFCFVLNSCSSNKAPHVINKLNNYFKENYSLEDGYLIALYDLTELNKNTKIYATNYALVINNNDYYKSFLEECKNKLTSKKINEVAYDRIVILKNLILELNNRYSFLSKYDANILEHNNFHNKAQYFKELAYIDRLIKNLPIMLPIRGSHITSNYGVRKVGRNKTKFHHGIDLQASHNSLIFATGDGVVKNACRQNGYGNIVEIIHSDKFLTKYAHLNDIVVRVGDNVNRGDIIGTQGRSGNARGEHLHHEILYNNRSVNPIIFLGHFFIADRSGLVMSHIKLNSNTKPRLLNTKSIISKPKAIISAKKPQKKCNPNDKSKSSTKTGKGKIVSNAKPAKKVKK